jgi:hypothetical protein
MKLTSVPFFVLSTTSLVLSAPVYFKKPLYGDPFDPTDQDGTTQYRPMPTFIPDPLNPEKSPITNRRRPTFIPDPAVTGTSTVSNDFKKSKETSGSFSKSLRPILPITTPNFTIPVLKHIHLGSQISEHEAELLEDICQPPGYGTNFTGVLLTRNTFLAFCDKGNRTNAIFKLNDKNKNWGRPFCFNTSANSIERCFIISRLKSAITFPEIVFGSNHLAGAIFECPSQDNCVNINARPLVPLYHSPRVQKTYFSVPINETGLELKPDWANHINIFEDYHYISNDVGRTILSSLGFTWAISKAFYEMTVPFLFFYSFILKPTVSLGWEISVIMTKIMIIILTEMTRQPISIQTASFGYEGLVRMALIQYPQDEFAVVSAQKSNNLTFASTPAKLMKRSTTDHVIKNLFDKSRSQFSGIKNSLNAVLSSPTLVSLEEQKVFKNFIKHSTKRTKNNKNGNLALRHFLNSFGINDTSVGRLMDNGYKRLSGVKLPFQQFEKDLRAQSNELAQAFNENNEKTSLFSKTHINKVGSQARARELFLKDPASYFTLKYIAKSVNAYEDQTSTEVSVALFGEGIALSFTVILAILLMYCIEEYDLVNVVENFNVNDSINFVMHITKPIHPDNIEHTSPTVANILRLLLNEASQVEDAANNLDDLKKFYFQELIDLYDSSTFKHAAPVVDAFEWAGASIVKKVL